jgi:hypothetical protein
MTSDAVGGHGEQQAGEAGGYGGHTTSAVADNYVGNMQVRL